MNHVITITTVWTLLQVLFSYNPRFSKFSKHKPHVTKKPFVNYSRYTILYKYQKMLLHCVVVYLVYTRAHRCRRSVELGENNRRTENNNNNSTNYCEKAKHWYFFGVFRGFLGRRYRLVLRRSTGSVLLLFIYLLISQTVNVTQRRKIPYFVTSVYTWLYTCIKKFIHVIIIIRSAWSPSRVFCERGRVTKTWQNRMTMFSVEWKNNKYKNKNVEIITTMKKKKKIEKNLYRIERSGGRRRRWCKAFYDECDKTLCFVVLRDDGDDCADGRGRWPTDRPSVHPSRSRDVRYYHFFDPGSPLYFFFLSRRSSPTRLVVVPLRSVRFYPVPRPPSLDHDRHSMYVYLVIVISSLFYFRTFFFCLPSSGRTRRVRSSRGQTLPQRRK